MKRQSRSSGGRRKDEGGVRKWSPSARLKVRCMKYFKTSKLRNCAKRTTSSFLIPTSPFNTSPSPMATTSSFLIPPSLVKTALSPRGIKITGRRWSVAKPLYVWSERGRKNPNGVTEILSFLRNLYICGLYAGVPFHFTPACVLVHFQRTLPLNSGAFSAHYKS